MLQRLSNQLFDVLRTLFRRGALFLLALIVSASVTLTPILSPTANAQGLTDLLSLGGSLTNGQSSCSIETVGWVICPTMRSIAKLADYGFTYINQSFLRIDYNIASTSSGTYTAWGLMRNIANALFVVAFMTLIYSQLTGRGGGYNIKRLIPKLLISAILVNISYYLCVAVIDVTNILGDSILAVLGEAAKRVGTSVMPIGTAAQNAQDGTLTTITAAVLGKGGVAWVLLAPVAAVTVSVATICAAGVVLLIMRKTVVAMLILVSPVLFVAYLLPNLERFFFQGVRLFAQLLLLYPIIALLLGAGQIVSATIVTVGSGDTGSYRVSGDNYSSRNGGSGSAITDLTAAAAAVLPLLAVWFVFKNMSSVMSTAGARLSASVSGRRGGKDDEKARVTGNATAGAAANKNIGGIGGNGGNRRQAFSRNRRHSSLAGSSLTGEDAAKAGQANRRPGENAAQNALDASVRGEGAGDAKKQLEELQNARLSAEAATGDVDMSAVAGGAAGAAAPAADKPKTAKDIFNNLNKTHDSKDKDRKFGAGGPAAGSGGGGGQAGGAAPQVAPTNSYRAPQIAQSGNIVSGTSAPQQQIKVVAVPVQIDGSALLGQNQAQPQSRPPDNVSQPPIAGTEEKAKARAQQYIFDSERDLDEARNKQDILGHKDVPTEPPHVLKDDEKDKE